MIEEMRNMASARMDGISEQAEKLRRERFKTEYDRGAAARANQRAAVNPKREVEQPDHYMITPDLEVKEVIRCLLTPEEYRGWVKGNALKYLMRADKKGRPDVDRQK